MGLAAPALSLAAQLALAPAGPTAWRDAGVGGARGVTVGPIENGYHPGVATARRLRAHARRGRGQWRDVGGHHAVRPRRQPLGPGRRPHLRGALRRNRAAILRASTRPTPAAFASCWSRTSGSSPASGARSSIRRPTRAGSVGGQLRPLRAHLGRGGRDRGRGSLLRRRRAALLGDERPRPELRGASSPTCAASTTASSPTPRTGTTSTRRVILGDLDVIGINAFYPLADHDGATDAELDEGGRARRERSTRSPRRGASPSSSPRSATPRAPTPPFAPGSGPTP